MCPAVMLGEELEQDAAMNMTLYSDEYVYSYKQNPRYAHSSFGCLCNVEHAAHCKCNILAV